MKHFPPFKPNLQGYLILVGIFLLFTQIAHTTINGIIFRAFNANNAATFNEVGAATSATDKCYNITEETLSNLRISAAVSPVACVCTGFSGNGFDGSLPPNVVMNSTYAGGTASPLDGSGSLAWASPFDPVFSGLYSGGGSILIESPQAQSGSRYLWTKESVCSYYKMCGLNSGDVVTITWYAAAASTSGSSQTFEIGSSYDFVNNVPIQAPDSDFDILDYSANGILYDVNYAPGNSSNALFIEWNLPANPGWSATALDSDGIPWTKYSVTLQYTGANGGFFDFAISGYGTDGTNDAVPILVDNLLVTSPEWLDLSSIAPTCSADGTPNNNGQISITASLSGSNKYAISSLNALSYDGADYASATTLSGALPQTIKTDVPNTGGTYIVRVFQGSADCYADQTITIDPVTCVAPFVACGDIPVIWLVDEDQAAPSLHLWSFKDYNDATNTGTDYGRVTYIDPITGDTTAFATSSAHGDLESMAVNQSTGQAYFVTAAKIAGGPSGGQTLFTYNLNDAAANKGKIALTVIGHIQRPNSWAAEVLALYNNHLYLADPVTGNQNTDTNTDILMSVDLGALNPNVMLNTIPTIIGPIQGLGQVNNYVDGMEILPDGTLYTVDGTDDHLYRVSLTTGAILEVMDNNIPGGIDPLADVETIVWDPVNSKLIGADNQLQQFVDLTLDGTNGNNLVTSPYIGTPGIYSLVDFEGSAMYVMCCNLTVNSAIPSACDVNGQYTLSVDVTYTNISGDITINGQTFTPSGVTGRDTFVLTLLTANGAIDVDVTAQSVTEVTCSATLADAYDAPVSCIAACAVTITSAVPTACIPATNTYNLAVAVNYADEPTGDITINVGGTNYTFTPDGTSPDTYTVTGLIPDGVQNMDVSATFVGDAACTHTLVDAYNAPTSCCQILMNATTNNQTVAACNCTLYDSGGAAGNYSDNTTYSVTLSSGSPNLSVRVDFSTFNIQNYSDFFYIYDGTSSSARQIGTYSGTNSPGIVTSSGQYMHIVFYSDGSVNAAGFEASVSCIPTAKIGSHVWYDENGNGTFDEASGLGINDVTLYLYKNDGTGNFVKVDSTVTAANGFSNQGYYVFVVDQSGEYKVEFPMSNEQLGGSLTTYTGTYGIDNNSDANTTDGFTPAFTMDINGTGLSNINPTLDAGYIATCPTVGTFSGLIPIDSPINTVTTVHGGQLSGSYPNSANLQRTIQAILPTGVVNVEMYNFNFPTGDTLYIYDGPTTASPLLAKVTGTSHPVYNIVSTGREMTFAIISNATTTGSYNLPFSTGDITITTCFGTTVQLSSDIIEPNSAVKIAGSGAGPVCMVYFDGNKEILQQEVTFCLNHDLSSGSTYWGQFLFYPTQTDPLDITELEQARVSWILANAESLGYDYNNNLLDAQAVQESVWGVIGQNYCDNLCQQAQAAVSSPAVQPILTLAGADTVAANTPIMYTLTTNAATINLSVSDGGALPSLCGSYPAGTSITGDILTIGATGTRTVQLCLTRTTATALQLYAYDTNVLNTGQINVYYPCDPKVQRFLSTEIQAYPNVATFGVWEAVVCNLTASADGTNVLCNGGTDGTATATASGNIAAVTYAWSNGGTTASISNLAAGIYTVTISESASCTAVSSYTVTEPPVMDITCDKTDVTTNGGSDGTASVVATGGTSPYTYLWNSNETTASISSKTAATYTVTVTDANGCTALCNSTINEPGCNLSATADGTNVLCNGGTDGTATATASGNIAAVTYAWSNGGTTATISNLAAGIYTVTISESASCTAVSSYTVTEPPVMDITCDKTDVTTNGGADGTASVNAAGGTSPYTYLWNSGETTASISNKTSATYTVTVTDANGCTALCNSTINEPGCNLSATADGTNVLCNGGTDGTATATASGNIAAVTYAWSNGGTTATINNLAAGIYTVTISESASCTAVASYTVTEPALLDITCDKTDVTTNGGSDGTATVSATGGTSPYTYLWNSGETTASISNKTAATYTVTVTDANNCTALCNSTINEPGCNLSASADGTNVLCNGGTNGTATATASGNTAVVTYLWSNGGTTATINNLAAGIYTVTISESASCTAVASYTVTEPAIMDVTCDKTDVTTNGGADGIASVSATGGTSPYTYLWNSGETTSSISGKTAGTYTVTVTDANGCTDACASSINEPGALCNLTGAGLAAVICNDSSTSADATDDYIGFTLNPTGTTLGSGYIVTVSSGSITPNTANYGSASNFQLQNGSAGSGNTITVTITDASDTNCKVQVDVSDPGSCSTPTCPPVKCLPISITKN